MSRLTKYTQTAGYNAGAEAYAKWTNPREIKINPDIAKLFENDRFVVDKIRDSMKANGFDKSEPLVIWKSMGCVVDGHTRLKAALEAGLEEVLVEEKEFVDVKEAKIYTLTRQVNRRNLTAGALLEIASLLDMMKDGGKNKGEVAKEIGIGRTTLYKAQEVNQKASEPVKALIRQGGLSINRVYEELTKKKDPDTYGEAEEKEKEEEEGPVTPKAAAVLNAGTEKRPDIPAAIKATINEISRLLEAFLEANEEEVLEGLEKAENIRAACELAGKLI
jgi:ParB family chromosome partitioning protein